MPQLGDIRYRRCFLWLPMWLSDFRWWRWVVIEERWVPRLDRGMIEGDTLDDRRHGWKPWRFEDDTSRAGTYLTNVKSHEQTGHAEKWCADLFGAL